MTRALVAVVGRPNVGKSTLFNRLIGERLAIVEDLPGTTRDRIYGTVEWRSRDFGLVDTGGLDDGKAEMDTAVRRQVEAAIEEADIVMFVVDAKTGIVPVEHDVADRLRRSGKPTLLVANKSDGWRAEAQSAEFYELGLGEPQPVSAIQGHGTGDLLDRVVTLLPPDDDVFEGRYDARIAIVGRPNVGKSSFLNALVGSERAVVSEIPGTTRDPIDTMLVRDGAQILLVDTAGIRRRGRIDEGIEKYALLRTVHALERADVAILLVDATEGIVDQDVHVAGYALEAGVGLVVAVNKWDIVEHGEEVTATWTADLVREFHFAPWLAHHFTSAKNKRNVDATLDDAIRIVATRAGRIPTGQLHELLVESLASHPPPTSRGRPVGFHHVTQADARTPTFVFFVDRPEAVHFSYQRYLENRIRERFGFQGTPIRLQMRGARDEKD
ncbi:MAG: ribosome biogenesis GTPase Der [Chloroflexi bacterium]|nr:ribosome biogenesis GTPase Der [Chloroflexota bacterium]